MPNGAAGGSSSGSGTNYGGGGGGGASGAAGGDGNASVAGNGGAGGVSDITSEYLDYGSGGGGGAGNNVTTAGLAGGAGAGAGAARNGNVTGGDGLDGRGGGGGGGGYQPATAGGRGGSGCVIIRYLGIMGNEIVVAGEPARYGTVEPSYQLIQQPVDGQSYEFSESTKLYRVLVKYGGGSGTKEDPYLIDYYDQLELISTEKARGYFKQTADISFPEWASHKPIDTVNELKDTPKDERFEYHGGG